MTESAQRFKFKNLDFTTKLLISISFIMLTPIVMVVPFREEYIYAKYFIYSSIINLFIAFIFLHIRNKYFRATSKIFGRNKEVFVIFCIWLFIFIVGALPFILAEKLTIVQGLFESISGWSTTGLTVVNVEETANIFLFYRSLSQFIGGLAFMLLTLLFTTGNNVIKLFSVDNNGYKLEKNIKSEIYIIVKAYTVIMLIGFVLYILFGMHWFDAIVHSMAAVSTGGFSSKADSIGYFNSIHIEMVTIFLMLSGTTSFTVLIMLLKRDFKSVKKIGEVKFEVIWVVSTVFITILLGLGSSFNSFLEGLRVGGFNIISTISTTGFSTTDIYGWNASMVYVVIILMIMGGTSGSTSGGLTLTRVYIMIEDFIYNMNPEKASSLKGKRPNFIKAYEKTYSTQDYISKVYNFYFFYMFVFFIGSFMLSISTNDIGVAMFQFISAFSTIGISTDIISMTTSNYVLIINIFGMILGRIEIFFVIFASTVIMKKPKETNKKVVKQSL